MNESRKQQFLDEIYHVSNIKIEPTIKEIRLALKYFEAISDFEEVWGTDVAEQPYYVINNLVEQLAEQLSPQLPSEFASDGESLRLSIARILFLYNRWCRENKIPADDGITRGKWVKAAKASTWVVKSPSHLQELLNETLSPEAAETADLCNRGVAWLAFAGLTKQEILTVPVGAFDLEDMTVTVQRDGGAVTIQLVKESQRCLNLLATLSSFTLYSPQYKDGVIRVRRYDSDRITRGVCKRRSTTPVAGPSNHIAFITNIFSKWRRAGEINLSYEGLHKSGFYYRAYLEELADGTSYAGNAEFTGRPSRVNREIHIEELDRFVAERIKEGGGKSQKSDTERVWRRKIYNEYLLWKRVSGVL